MTITRHDFTVKDMDKAILDSVVRSIKVTSLPISAELVRMVVEAKDNEIARLKRRLKDIRSITEELEEGAE